MIQNEVEFCAKRQAEAGRMKLQQQLAHLSPTKEEIDALIEARMESFHHLFSSAAGYHPGGRYIHGLDRALFENPDLVLALHRAFGKKQQVVDRSNEGHDRDLKHVL